MKTADEIRAEIHHSISRITGIASDGILDSSSYRNDLGLDSLSMLELAVNMEYAFKIKVPEEQLQTIATVQDSIRLVQEHLAALES